MPDFLVPPVSRFAVSLLISNLSVETQSSGRGKYQCISNRAGDGDQAGGAGSVSEAGSGCTARGVLGDNSGLGWGWGLG